MAIGWKLHGDGKTPPPGEVVGPDERLSWPRTAGIGAQHVVAMFGATFVFPLVMGLDPNLAVMMSGVATILFLLIVQGKVPSYLGTSASFVGGVFAIRAGVDTAQTDGWVTGAILVAGVVLALSGLLIHVLGPRIIHAVFPPVVTGAVVMLIGFGLAFVVADTYWPQDHWVALLTMVFVFLVMVLLRGFLGRIAILLGLVFGFALSWLLDRAAGQITSVLPGQNLLDASGKACAPEGPYCVATAFPHDRVSFAAVEGADWFGLPQMHAPDFKMSAILLVLPAVIALIAENTGHVKAVGEMTGADLDPMVGRTIFADGVGTVVTSSVGGSPTTTYAENIGVMAATRIYSTAAYYVAALIAILFGLCPKFGALVAATPGGVLGGVTVILYGMIGLLGAKIWIENRVDFADPVNMVPVGAGIILALGPVVHPISDDFRLEGIALGTIVVLAGYHLLRGLSRRSQEPAPPSGGTAAAGGTGGEAVAGGDARP
ncbi:solute carrier family 23 protein [Actinomadura viridis]|uniref:Uracil-xanthine permease n=1 Tax=Actinomadura viridis TaxID=58110 RepID=A0A931DJW7_9ACTN|nr:solute carrier family 23 protein [Actinomadura viridis]MBG6088365.1 uracil-xanthine permease [Actinomadura viridis]